MNLLAIDTACSILSIAVSRNEEILYEEKEAGTRHSELVMNCIDSLMKKAALNPGDLHGILCIGGPGSFTGLRIGYSIAKGLALSLSIPFAPVPTLDCIAYPYSERSLILPVIEAGKSSWFFAFFSGGKCFKPATEAAAVQIAAEIKARKEIETEKIILTGPGSSSLYDSLPSELRGNIAPAFEKRGLAREMIAIEKAVKRLDNNSAAFLYSCPEYIRKTDTELRACP
jgi:tRNA threonylcarbamoyladenosine biosynthesis protein TsaB